MAQDLEILKLDFIPLAPEDNDSQADSEFDDILSDPGIADLSIATLNFDVDQPNNSDTDSVMEAAQEFVYGPDSPAVVYWSLENGKVLLIRTFDQASNSVHYWAGWDTDPIPTCGAGDEIYEPPIRHWNDYNEQTSTYGGEARQMLKSQEYVFAELVIRKVYHNLHDDPAESIGNFHSIEARFPTEDWPVQAASMLVKTNPWCVPCGYAYQDINGHFHMMPDEGFDANPGHPYVSDDEAPNDDDESDMSGLFEDDVEPITDDESNESGNEADYDTETEF